MALPGLPRLSRLWPWTKELPAPNGLAATNGHEKKESIDFIGDMGGRIVYAAGIESLSDSAEVSRATAYAAAAYIYVAIRYRAECVSQPALRVYERTDDGDEVLDDHEIYDLLHEPSPDYDLGEILEITQTYWDLEGDACWVKDSNLAGLTGRLTPFSGREFDVKSTKDRIFGEFVIKTRSGPKTFKAEDIVHFRYPGAVQRTRGVSPTDVALHWLNLGQRTTATIRTLLTNAMFPSVVITTHPDWSPDYAEFARFKAMIDQYHTGPQNAGKPFIALGGGRVERVSFSLAELLPSDLLDRVEAVVSSCFRIPPIVLGHLVGLKNSPWSQMEQAHHQAYSDAIQPLWRRIERALNRQLLREVDQDPKHFFRFDMDGIAALAEDESKKVTDATSATYWSVNERRAYTGQDPLPDDDERGDFIELTDKQPVPIPGAPGTPPPDGEEEDDEPVVAVNGYPKGKSDPRADVLLTKLNTLLGVLRS